MLGWNVQEYDSEAGTITVRFDAKAEFCNAGGIIHGGFLAAMLDDTLAPALGVMVDENQYTPTIELKLNYLRPAKVGPIIGKANVIRRGRNIGFVEGRLEDEAGQVLVTATGTFMIVTMKE
ncbi:MAG: phenylacetic acid degradation protein [Candidatus Hydrogenedentota bacterium]|nr:MAG: phenylacetic acid degradation protein [Candidatus Hydrogenedentota bacterium]